MVTFEPLVGFGPGSGFIILGLMTPRLGGAAGGDGLGLTLIGGFPNAGGTLGVYVQAIGFASIVLRAHEKLLAR